MKSKFLITLFLVFGVGAIALFWWFRSHGFSARAEPSWIEKKLAQHARRIATPADAKAMKNPFPETEASLTEAKEHFVEHCSMCHGIDGRGQTVIGRNLYPKVPPMTDANTQQLTDGELFYIISNGVRFTGMPAWGTEDSPESIWGLVAFIRRLPKLTPEEIKLMQETAADANDHEAREETKDERDAKGQNQSSGGHKHVKPHSH